MKMKDGTPVVECRYNDDRTLFMVGWCPLCGGSHTHGSAGQKDAEFDSIVGHRVAHCRHDAWGKGYYLELRSDELWVSAGSVAEDVLDRQGREMRPIEMQPGEERKVFLLMEDGEPVGIDVIPDFGSYSHDHPYFIEWDRINTDRNAIHWMSHLADKVWGTQVIGQLFKQLHRCGVIEFRS